ncbi:MAG: dihydropteroate synthase [Desulfobulbus sp.]|jgi:dihydropteroate synthase|nr:dihydropteroate synthase [Desulfobulbus sp.]
MQIMGIVNVTPDSFSDGGRWQDEDRLAARIDQLLAEGADLIDVGGESTRPFAQPVGEAEELARVLPAVRAVRTRSTVPVSVDTTKAAVARAALEEGADLINDISALRHDPAMVGVVRDSGCRVVVMHMLGTPGDMQLAPHYEDVVAEINRFLAGRIAWLEEQGVDRSRVIVDPGLGFGKTLAHNLDILRRVETFARHGCPVLIGHSRKSFFGRLLGLEVAERDPATAVVSALLAGRGVDILRVHDVRASRQAVQLAEALC